MDRDPYTRETRRLTEEEYKEHTKRPINVTIAIDWPSLLWVVHVLTNSLLITMFVRSGDWKSAGITFVVGVLVHLYLEHHYPLQEVIDRWTGKK